MSRRKGPIHRNAQFALQPRQLKKVDRAPEPPGKKTGELETPDLRHRRSPAETREHAKGPVGELLFRLIPQGGSDVVRNQRSLSDGILCRGR